MKTIWKSDCTEYEFGQRPDGSIISDNIEKLKVKIEKSNTGGSRECYWRYSQPVEVYCTDKIFKALKKIADKNESGIVHLGNHHSYDFYKKI